MRPYADTMRELIAGVGRAASSVRTLPLLQQRETVETVLLVPLTGDRGLAGAFNAQVLRRAFALERELRAEGKTVRWLAAGKKGRSTLTLPPARARRRLHRLHRPPAYADAQAIAHRAGRALRRGRGRPRRPRLQHVRLRADAARHRAGRPADLGRHPRDGRGGARRRRPARRLHLRAGAGGDPRAAAARLRRDADLPRAARVGRVRAGRADDGDAERVEERGRADRPAHAAT